MSEQITEKCGNCGIERIVDDEGMVERCGNCGDDEYPYWPVDDEDYEPCSCLPTDFMCGNPGCSGMVS